VRVVRYDRFQGIDGLWIDDVPEPTPGSGQVTIRVQASCINPGSVSALHGAPYTPARDVAGTVVAVGDGVVGLCVGQEVLGWVQDWAAHAEIVPVPADQLIAKPADLPWDVAGSLFVTPMAGLASVQAVSPQPGEMILVAGASGGVGLAASQLTRRRGAQVVGIAGPGSADRLRAHGITPVAYGDGVVDRIQEATGGRIDAFIDAVGAEWVETALSLGVRPERVNTVVDYAAARQHGVKALGTMEAGGTSSLTKLAALAAAGQLTVPIASTHGLAQVQAAYRQLVDARPYGRVVLHPQK